MKLRNLVVFAAVLLASLASFAQAPAATRSKRDDIVRLLRMTGAAKGATQALDLILPSLREAMPQVPDQVWSEFRNELREDDMIQLTYTIWDKHFTHEEIRDLIRFYQTPTGRKIISETPAIQQESLIAGQKWGNEIVTRILTRLREKGYQPPPSMEQP